MGVEAFFIHMKTGYYMSLKMKGNLISYLSQFSSLSLCMMKVKITQKDNNEHMGTT